MADPTLRDQATGKIVLTQDQFDAELKKFDTKRTKGGVILDLITGLSFGEGGTSKSPDIDYASPKENRQKFIDTHIAMSDAQINELLRAKAKGSEPGISRTTPTGSENQITYGGGLHVGAQSSIPKNLGIEGIDIPKSEYDKLLAEIFSTFASPGWESKVGDLMAKVSAGMRTSNNEYTQQSEVLYRAYTDQLTAARDRSVTTGQDAWSREEFFRRQLQERELAQLGYQQALLTNMIQNPFKYRALTGQGLYLGPQNLGDYSRMDPFRQAQYGAHLGLIGETPESIGRMETPAGFAQQVAPLVTGSANVRRSV